MKRELVGLILFLDELKMNWERIIGTLTKDYSTRAFQRERELSEKCGHIDGGHVKKKARKFSF
jgi:hypothetical protein